MSNQPQIPSPGIRKDPSPATPPDAGQRDRETDRATLARLLGNLMVWYQRHHESECPNPPSEPGAGAESERSG